MESTEQFKTDPSQLTEVFPTAAEDYVLPRIKAIESLIRDREYEIITSLHKPLHEQDSWFVREVVKAFDIPDLIELKKERRRLMRYLPAPPKPARGFVDSEEIRRAKESSIVGLANERITSLKKCARLYRALCPFHDEKNPSFYIYPETNSYHCFGCDAHGDVISLAQKLYGYTFVEAVKHLR